MSEGSRDRIEGTVNEATGRGKSAFGDLTGNEQTQAEGEMDQAHGQMQQGVGDVKDKVADTVDNAKDKLGDMAKKLTGGD